ncbi:MAG: hypothetical protein Q8J89_13815 [Caulobacter sp.]|nr:hypothetical protein [Caulobacter sp.]
MQVDGMSMRSISRLADVSINTMTKLLADAAENCLAVLIGFKMAALAARSTFERAGIDQPLKGGDAILCLGCISD